MHAYRRYLKNCGWLLAPAAIWNVVFAQRLPEAFAATEFWRDIPPALGLIERSLRVVTFALPCLMPLAWNTPLERRRLWLFGCGTALYFASWTALIVAPTSAWSQSAAGFLAPAVTPALWLVPLATIGRELFWGRFYKWWMYLVPATGFLAAHITHTTIVWSRH